MNHYEKIERLKDADFKQLIGVKRKTFPEMVKVLNAEYLKKHEREDANPNLRLKRNC